MDTISLAIPRDTARLRHCATAHAGSLAQEFTTTRQVASQSEPDTLQLANPLAPRQYGSGAQVVVADPQDPQERPYAARSFSVAF
jgi:hypothetical protein